ncbi:GntR family transcriptional regulator [Caballeronia sp. LZ065]|uniref:GntR family transcriptional regulator n=1 Tax=Caballeronia sp. LZ065 TaxID=3038571 RepID=UPI00286087B5|nr:GntR family transcriptional regulator [Caballeronia sp. LZ065]MDR5781300.1 GntR family transcriptional regulator [Caballeronia sp. LZ065]
MDQLHIPQRAREISLYIRAAALTPGTRLPERKLAEQFRVSRTPVSRALRLLADWNVVVPSTTGGYLVGDQAATVPSQTTAKQDLSDEESLYLKLAEEHSANQLSGKQSKQQEACLRCP